MAMWGMVFVWIIMNAVRCMVCKWSRVIYWHICIFLLGLIGYVSDINSSGVAVELQRSIVQRKV